VNVSQWCVIVNLDLLRSAVGTMAQVPVPEFEKHWQNKLESFRSECKDIVKQFPDSRDAIEKVYNILSAIVSLTGSTHGAWTRAKPKSAGIGPTG